MSCRYYLHGETLYSNISDIEGRIRHIESLFDWAPVSIGSPLRSHAYSYRNWGIVITPDNIEWLRAESKKAFRVEWAETDASLNHLIAEASEKADLADTNMLLNEKIAEFATEHILRLVNLSKEIHNIKIMDLGAGAGGTSGAFIRKLASLDMELYLELTLIEPSEMRLKTAEELIRTIVKGTKLEKHFVLVDISGTVDQLKLVENEEFDLLISNAAIHHESFNDHLNEIHRVLKPGAPFVSGDWHESNYEHPARAYWIYFLLQNPFDAETASKVIEFVKGSNPPKLSERAELQEFRQLFGMGQFDVYDAFKDHTKSERLADVGSIKYWLELGKKFSGQSKKCPELLLQCHERVSKRVELLTNAGFSFDEESRRKYSEVISDRGYGELAAVMVPKKQSAR